MFIGILHSKYFFVLCFQFCYDIIKLIFFVVFNDSFVKLHKKKYLNEFKKNNLYIFNGIFSIYIFVNLKQSILIIYKLLDSLKQ